MSARIRVDARVGDIVAAVLLCSAANAQTFDPYRVVSHGPFDLAVHECTVAAVPNDPGRVVALWMAGTGPSTGPIYYRMGSNGGYTWDASEYLLTDASALEADPSVAATSDGRFVAVWLWQDRFHGNQVRAARMSAGSRTFGPYQALTGLAFHDFCNVAVGPGPEPGQVYAYAVWLQGNAIWQSRLTDIDAGSWEPPVQILSPGSAPTVVVGSSGTVFVGYTVETQPGVWLLRMAKSSDYGQSYTVIPTFEQPIAKSNFEPYVPGTYRVANACRPAVHPTNPNLVYAAFTNRTGDEDLSTGDGDCDIYLRRSIDGGTTWLPAVKVNGGPVGVTYDEFMPRITVDASGRVHVTWCDTRLDHPDNDPLRIDYTIQLYYAVSTNGGVSFTEYRVDPDVKVDQLIWRFFIGDYNGICWSHDATTTYVLPVWMATYWSDWDDPVGFDEMIAARRIRY